MPESEMRPEFVEQATRLRAKALAAPAKTVHGQAVTGAMLAALCESYAQAIAQGVPQSLRQPGPTCVPINVGEHARTLYKTLRKVSLNPRTAAPGPCSWSWSCAT